jgi:hypothetical protein
MSTLRFWAGLRTSRPTTAQHLGRVEELPLIVQDLAFHDEGGENGGDELRLAIGRRWRAITVGNRLGGAVGWRRFGDLADGAAVVVALLHINFVSRANLQAGELLGPDFELLAVGCDHGRDLLAEFRRMGFGDFDQHGTASLTCP